jgi:hypothetical protein
VKGTSRNASHYKTEPEITDKRTVFVESATKVKKE